MWFCIENQIPSVNPTRQNVVSSLKIFKVRGVKGMTFLLLGVVAVLSSIEVGLTFLGLNRVPLYESSDNYEYRFVPNQNCTVMGKKLVVNKLGLRGELPENNGDVVVWYCGDSVINGGIRTDEDSLATTIWEQHAEDQSGSRFSSVNVSQGSWGPENTYNFCKEHFGDLGDPNLIVLAVSSHDWNDRMTFCYEGHSQDMPGRNFGAIGNVLNKYFGNYNACTSSAEPTSPPKGAEFDQWLDYSKELDTQMILYLHPTIAEIRAGHYDLQGNQILDWAGTNEVFVCEGLDFLDENGFRDNIHLNELGQRQLADFWVDCIQFPVDTNTTRPINV